MMKSESKLTGHTRQKEEGALFKHFFFFFFFLVELTKVGICLDASAIVGEMMLARRTPRGLAEGGGEEKCVIQGYSSICPKLRINADFLFTVSVIFKYLHDSS